MNTWENITNMAVAADFSMAELCFMQEAIKFAKSNPECFKEWACAPETDPEIAAAFIGQVGTACIDKLGSVHNICGRSESDYVFTVERTDKNTVYDKWHDDYRPDFLVYSLPFFEMVDCATEKKVKQFIVQTLVESYSERSYCDDRMTVGEDAAVLADICEYTARDCARDGCPDNVRDLFFALAGHNMIETMSVKSLKAIVEAMGAYLEGSDENERKDLSGVVIAAVEAVKNNMDNYDAFTASELNKLVK